jgi:glycosyltransferase involved in cell wall biosynthesis
VAILHQGFVPTYRRRLYELLAERATEYVVFHGDPPPGTGHRAASPPFAFPNVWVHNRFASLAGRTVVYQPVLKAIMRGGFDAVVLGGEVKYLSSVGLFFAGKARRRPVVLWGQGTEKAEDVRGMAAALSGAGGRLKIAAARAADGYLVYTEGGAAQLREQGVRADRVFVVRNTLDMKEQSALREALRDEDPASLRSELGLRPDSTVLVYLGRLYGEKRLEELVELTRRLDGDPEPKIPVETLVIGDGPARAPLEALGSGVRGLRFVGEITDQALIARYLRVAAALVIPGKVGLAANHAFAHGLPVITRQSVLHAPEIEYVEHGRNGLVIAGDFDAFVRAVARFVESPDEQGKLSSGALKASEGLAVEAMAEQFDRGVRAALQRRRG